MPPIWVDWSNKPLSESIRLAVSVTNANEFEIVPTFTPTSPPQALPGAVLAMVPSTATLSIVPPSFYPQHPGYRAPRSRCAGAIIPRQPRVLQAQIRYRCTAADQGE